MVVDVLYDGVPLAKATNVREEGAGAFIELEAPMPVGTRLTVRGPDGERHVRVERVHEGVGPGVHVKFVEAGAPGESMEASATVPDEPRDGARGDDKKGGAGQAKKDRRNKKKTIPPVGH